MKIAYINKKEPTSKLREVNHRKESKLSWLRYLERPNREDVSEEDYRSTFEKYLKQINS